VSTPIRVLVLEDRPADAELMVRELRRAGFEPDWQRVETEAEYLARLHPGLDVILADYTLPQFDALRALRLLREQDLDVPVIVVASTIGEEAAVACMKEGAADYLLQDRLARLGPAVARALQQRKLRDEQRRAGERLRLLSSAVEQSTAGIAVSDLEGHLLFVNDAFAAQHGYAPGELLGEHLSIFHTPEQMPAVEAANRQVQETGGFSDEIWHVRRDGTVFPSLMHSSLLRDERGNPIGMIGTLRDITERIQAEAELRRIKEFNESIVQSVTEGIVMEDAEGCFTFVNPAAADLLGYTTEELTGQHWTVVVPPDQQPIVRAADERHMLGQADRYELEQVRKDGTRLPVLVSGSPRFDPDTGDFAGTLAVFTDINERKRAETELRESKERYRSLYSMVRLMCDNVPDMIWAKDLEKRYLFANEAICEKLLNARDTDEPLGKTDLFFAERERDAHPEHPEWHTFGEICADSDAVVMSSRQPQRFDEFGNVRGGFMFLDVYKAPFWNEEGEMIGTVGCGRIVTREKKVEKQREEAREALRRRTEQLEALRQVGLEIAAQLDLDALLHSIVSRAVELVGGIIGGFYLYRPDQEVLEVRVAVGVDPAIVGLTLRPGEGLAGKVWETGEPIVVEDYQHWAGRAAVFDDQSFRAAVGVPVRWGQEFVGVLDVVAGAPGVFSTSDVELLSLLATQAVIAIQNARLYEETLRRNRELTLLNRVIAASAASQEIAPILETVCRELAQALEVAHSAAVLLNGEKTEAVVVAEHRANGRPSILGQTVPLTGVPLAQHLIQHQAPLVVDDARADPCLGPICNLIDPSGTIGLLILPILVEEEMMGCLGVAAVGPRSFSPEEVELAWRVAEQVSGALARARLAQTERRLSAAVEQAAEAVMVTDTEGAIRYVNPAFERITGYSRAEVVGQSPRILRSAELDAAFRREMRQVVTAGQVWQERFDYRRKDGSVRVLDLTVAPVRNPVGEIVSYVTTMRDVTREVQLERQFQQAQKMEALGRLAGGVAHDFNNLLTIMELSTRLLERQLHPEDPLREHVQRILEAGQRATRLTRQLLSFSRREVVAPHALNLNQVVGDLGRMLQRIMGEDVRLLTALADDLWPIKMDPAQMDQVILNLVVNARDAMPGGGALTIETDNVILDEAYAASHVEAQPGEHVLLVVSDTGMGMDEEVKAHLFEPFFTTKERGQGTGLGLATVFGIVKQNRGHIEVYSEVGQGTTFKIYLPRTPDAGAVPSAPSRAIPPIAARLARGTETVLLVEDDVHVRDLIVRVLESCGYQVLVAGDGLQALQIGEQHAGAIHLLLTDVGLPKMNGKELAGQLRSARPAMRVLYMSGHSDSAIVRRGVLAPGVALLFKPFTIEDLTQKVREVLEGKT